MPRNFPLLAGAAAFTASLAFGYRAHQVTDVEAVYRSGWVLARHGNLLLPAALQVPQETVLTAAGAVSDRMPGLVLLTAPLEALYSAPSWAPALLLAALCSAVTVWGATLLWGRWGAATALLTPVLSVAGRTLWPETVCCALLVLALLARRAGRYWALVPLVAACVLVRPPAALLLVLVLVVDAWRRPGARRVFSSSALGLLVGVVGLVAWCRWAFGIWLPAGSYGAHSVGATDALGQVVIGLFSPARGLLVWCPWLLALVFVRDRRALALVGAAGLYSVGCWVTYNAWGGTGFLGPRYPLPLLLLACPLLGSVPGWVRRSLPVLTALAWTGACALLALAHPVILDPARDATMFGFPADGLLALVVALALGVALARRIGLVPLHTRSSGGAVGARRPKRSEEAGGRRTTQPSAPPTAAGAPS